MLTLLLQAVLIVLLGYLLVSVGYMAFFTLVYFCVRDRQNAEHDAKLKFLILVPAHDEALIIRPQLENLQAVEYPNGDFQICVIADNCKDRTAAISREQGVEVLERFDSERRGKGYAIQFALDKLDLDRFDAVLIVDADTLVDRCILTELGGLLGAGEEVVQCYIQVPNREESWFTSLLAVSRVINGLFYHYPKHLCGLSSYLMGTGICFSTRLLKSKQWTAFSIAEDWEYYAQLLLDGYRVAFARNALVYQQESKDLGQATSQRLRWSSGRYQVLRTLGIRLFSSGIQRRNWQLVDASLPLLLPNFSLQINLTLLAMALAFVLLGVAGSGGWMMWTAIVLLSIQALIGLAGAVVSGAGLSFARSLLLAPVFLLWKCVIDLLSFSGLYRGRTWVRTRRYHAPTCAEDGTTCFGMATDVSEQEPDAPERS